MIKKWKYYIEGTEVFPTNYGMEEYDFSKIKPTDVQLTRSLKSKIRFKYSDPGFDFKAQEASDPSKELSFVIKQKCGAVYNTFFDGIFTLAEGSYDDFRCIFEITPRLKENIFQADVTVNFFGGPTLLKSGGNIGVFTGTGGTARNHTSAFTFGSVMLSLAKKINPKVQGIVSDFFQINPNVISSDCLPGIANPFTTMAFCALSDIQEPIPSNLSTYNPVKFSDLIDDLYTLFDVFVWVDTNFNLRIEHRTYFDGAVWLDLTSPIYKDYVSLKRYKFNLDDYPKTEVWSVIDSSQYARIAYNQISNVNKNTNEKSQATKLIRTDYADIRYNGNNHEEYGLFLFATELSSGKYIMRETLGQNMYLSPPWLVPNIHTYDRSYLGATIEGIYVHSGGKKTVAGGFIAQSRTKPILYNSFKIPLCCDESIDIQSQINTSFGTAYVHSAKYSAKESMLELEIKRENLLDIQKSPSDLAALDLWLKADTGVTYNGSNEISQWDDQSGNARHVTQAVTINKPIYDVASSRVILSSSQFLASAAFSFMPAKRGTIMIAYESPLGSIPEMTFISNQGPVYWDLSWLSDFINHSYGVQYSSKIFNIKFLGTSTKKGVLIVNRFSDTQEKYKTNALFPGEGESADTITVANTQPSASGIKIGYNSGVGISTSIAQFFLSEVIVFGRSLSDEEMIHMEYYFAKRGVI